ncbi:MAG: hypothetical protein WCD86_10370, partial [Ktedonobacteraceae bacterium]
LHTHYNMVRCEHNGSAGRVPRPSLCCPVPVSLRVRACLIQATGRLDTTRSRVFFLSRRVRGMIQ